MAWMQGAFCGIGAAVIAIIGRSAFKLVKLTLGKDWLLWTVFIVKYRWLDERQFLDAVAVAMITPGPVVITVAFIGYLAAGPIGALVAAIATFLPCYFFTVIPAPYFRLTSAIEVERWKAVDGYESTELQGRRQKHPCFRLRRRRFARLAQNPTVSKPVLEYAKSESESRITPRPYPCPAPRSRALR